MDKELNLNQSFEFFKKLSTSQKLIIAGVLVVTLIAVISLVMFVNSPDYGTLFSNLAPQDASKIVEKLKEKSIAYKLEGNGSTILVPKEIIYDLRLSLAGEGLPQSSIVGYEIFDKTNLGISDFVQKVNYRRALEGELARTILQIGEVEGARVHIVLPERKLFKEDEKPPTASVILKLRTGKAPSPETIQGIVHLISSSVEGLDPENVTVVDSRGMLLSNNNKQNNFASLTAAQYELQHQVEASLTSKAQSLLDGVLGANNAIVQVNAELDFRQVERTMEKYDPENTAIRSEQLSEDKTTSKDSSPSSIRTNTVTNYEINKEIERIIENQGSIKRISIAVTVNGKQKVVTKGNETVTENEPRTEDELMKISEVVKRAVGYNVQRGDEISVVNLPFAVENINDDFQYQIDPVTKYDDWIKLLIIAIAMGAAVVILLSLLKRFKNTDNSIEGIAALAPSALQGKYDAILNQGNRREVVAELLNNNPEEASRLLKAWLADEE